jgi:hypothetical protein
MKSLIPYWVFNMLNANTPRIEKTKISDAEAVELSVQEYRKKTGRHFVRHEMKRS